MSDKIVHAFVEFLSEFYYCSTLLKTIKLAKLLLELFPIKTQTNFISKLLPTSAYIMSMG